MRQIFVTDRQQTYKGKTVYHHPPGSGGIIIKEPISLRKESCVPLNLTALPQLILHFCCSIWKKRGQFHHHVQFLEKNRLCVTNTSTQILKRQVSRHKIEVKPQL